MTLADIEAEFLTLHNAISIRTNLEKARRAGELIVEAHSRLKPHR